MVSLTTSRSSTFDVPARSRWTYSTTLDERVTSNLVRLPHSVQRHRVAPVGKGTVVIVPSSFRRALMS